MRVRRRSRRDAKVLWGEEGRVLGGEALWVGGWVFGGWGREGGVVVPGGCGDSQDIRQGEHSGPTQNKQVIHYGCHCK